MEPAPITGDGVSARRPRRFTIFAVCASALAATAFAIGALPDDAAAIVVNTPYTGARLLCVVAIVLIVSHMHGEERRAWRFIAAGALLASLGDLVYDWYDVVLQAEAPYPGISDLFDLSAYGFWMAGVFTFPYSKGSRYAQWRLILDGAAGAVALGLVAWRAYLAEAMEFHANTLLENLVGAAYPLADLVLLVALVVLSTRRTIYRLHRPLMFLVAAFLSVAVADILYLLDLGNYADGGAADGMWVAGHGLIALAAWFTTLPVRGKEYPDQRASVRRLVVPYTMVAGLIVITGYQVLVGGHDIMTKTLVFGAGVVSTLVLVRQSVALREHRELVENERRDLVASISHELRTPLTAISGFSRVLADDWRRFPAEAVDEMVESVAEQTEYLGRIVTDLIEISRDNLHQVPLQPSVAPLSLTIGKAISLANLEGHDGLIVNVRGQLELSVDHGRVTQILVNLLTNARRYGRGRAHIEVIERHDSVSIDVHDDGDGVPIRYREIIWERFERGVHRYDAAIGGTGLGLPIARGLTAAHQGTLTYRDSEVLGGACFSVTLPLTRFPHLLSAARAR